MAALTAMLLGLAGALVWLIGRPVETVPTELNRDATLAAAGQWRTQALAAGLTAEQARTRPDLLDLRQICSAAAGPLLTRGLAIADCRLDTAGLTVILTTGETGTAVLADASAHCLTVQTSWQEALPARCPGAGASADLEG